MKNKLIKSVTILSLVFCFTLAPTNDISAQCPMCRTAAENNLKDGGTAGKGLNKGILYMLMTPYVLVGTIGFIWWRNRKKGKDDNFEE